jgi:hypothetical protein
MNSNKKTARIAGLWYLGNIVLMAFSWIYVDSIIYVSGDAAATANNILASEQLLRLGFVSGLVGMICSLVAANMFYKLFKPVNRDLARLMVIFVVVDNSVLFLNTLFKFAPVLLLNSTDYLSAFETSKLQALAMMFLDLYKHGEWMCAIFFGLWLLPIGLLILKSDIIPKIIGILLIISCVFYVIQFFTFFLLPSRFESINPVLEAGASIGEILFFLWILIKGAKERNPMDISADADCFG